ncbi:MAG: hypothetical protein EOO47_00110 [Flavobacterium sp.]|nr:MAG: hypothetical protein EOO47_00110 [Flavobacterium sp.]
MFKREDYYSQTEACKRFKISQKVFQKIIDDYQLDVIEKEITLHTAPEGLPYNVVTKYVYKLDFIRGLTFYNQWTD